MNRRHFLSLAGAFAALPAQAGSAPSDIAVFRAAMMVHPGLYRYNAPKVIAQRLDRLEAEYRTAPSLEAKYLLLSKCLASLKCGHSYCNFFNQDNPAVLELFDRPTRLPFYFEWLKGDMVITHDHSDGGRLLPGTRIVSVNGVPVAHLLSALMPLARADGHNDAKRSSILGVAGTEAIEFFDVFQGLLFPPADATHRLELVGPDGRHGRVEVPAHTLKARQSVMTRIPEDSDQPRWSWTMRNDGIAILDMPGWAMWNSRWDWQTWLADRLDSLGGAKGLIVDIRTNEGGDDCGNPILARLVDTPLAASDFQERVRFETVPESLAPHVSTWDESFKSIGVGGRKLADGFIERPTSAAAAINPSGKQLEVPVAVLIGPANSSATFAFVHAARSTGKVRLFGGPTGGNLRGINGGAFFFTRLPDSGIEFDLPLVGYFPRTPQPDRGIDPDVKVIRSAEDIAQGRDPVLAAAVTWLAS